MSAKNKPSNYVILTLRAVKDTEAKFTDDGVLHADVRAALGQGKNEDGSYKPSVFFDVKAAGKDVAVNEAIQRLAKGGMFTVKGNLALRQWTTPSGEVRDVLMVWAKAVEPFSFEPSPETSDELEGEPA